jgi:hypothetical protein
MVRVKRFAVAAAVLSAAALYAGPTLAKPLPIASPDEIETMAGAPVYRQCFWADGYRLCRAYYQADNGFDAPPAPNYGSYGAPGIYLDNTGVGRNLIDGSAGP